jgi:transposase
LFSVSTRSRRSRRCSGPRRSCRSCPGCRKRPPTTTSSPQNLEHGTTTLFAALEVATGKIVDSCLPRHRHQEFLRFLRQVAKAYPRRKLHIVCDNYATHKHPTVTAWLTRNPRITLHFTPTSGSWLNMVEIFFGIITRQAIRRGSFDSVSELVDAIRRFIDAWNERCEPFTWTKDPDTVLAKAQRQETSDTQH